MSKGIKSIEKYIEAKTNPTVYCKYCGRLLKTIKSKAQGYGDYCHKKHIAKHHKKDLIGG